jgi:hypothetical protein
LALIALNGHLTGKPPSNLARELLFSEKTSEITGAFPCNLDDYEKIPKLTVGFPCKATVKTGGSLKMNVLWDSPFFNRTFSFISTISLINNSFSNNVW